MLRARLYFLVVGSVLVTLAVVSVSMAAGPQTQVSLLKQMTTPERVNGARWWPTKMTASRDEFVGPQVCARCHSAVVWSQQKTEMAQTLMKAHLSPVLAGPKQFTLGPYAYNISRAQDGVTMTVTDGSRQLSAPLVWAFGVGRTGQSYLWEHAGNFYESRFNYFGSMHGFDVTPGRMRGAPDSLESAVGRPMTEAETRACLVCHSTAMTSEKPVKVDRLIPGVTCEACHGPGAYHAALQQNDAEHAASLIMNPKNLSPGESVDFCGSCHGTFWDIELGGASGVATVRFPAYRLQKSRCWGTDDARITCVACHDPHKPLVRQTASYDSACLRCHTQTAHAAGAKEAAVAKTCPVGKKDCASCHMPKYEVPEMHNTFTDHRIRVAKAGAFEE